MSTFGQRMRELRKSKGITLEVLSEALDTTKATLSRYENDKRVPDINIAKGIADYLGVTTDYLLCRTDDPNGEEEIVTIAAHHDGDEFTEEEKEMIEKFKDMVREMKKKKGQ